MIRTIKREIPRIIARNYVTSTGEFADIKRTYAHYQEQYKALQCRYTSSNRVFQPEKDDIEKSNPYSMFGIRGTIFFTQCN